MQRFIMITKDKLKGFVDVCISSGKYIETGLNLQQKRNIRN